ncbi:MAG: DUF4410 domain-containing protein [Candidatus Methylomirabilales bacterium]
MKREHRLCTQLFPPLLVVSLLVSLVVGCAGGSARQTRQHVKAGTLPRPPVLLLYDFAVAPADAPPSEKIRQDRAIARSLSEQTVIKLGERGIRAQRATASTTVPLHAVVVKGQFVTIEEGSRGKRVLIGFGAGKEELRARAQVYQMMEGGLKIISEGEGEAHGASRPGLAAPAIVAGATGSPVGLVVGGAMHLYTEISGPVKQNIGRLADRFAERAVAFYSRQGWR